MKVMGGHEFMLIAIDYFIKWLESTSYAKIIAKDVAKFHVNNIICRYDILGQLVSDEMRHFRTPLDKYKTFNITIISLSSPDKWTNEETITYIYSII